MKRSIPALLALVCWLIPQAPSRAAQLGDAAPPLEIAEWVKGDAVDLSEAKGKNVVVVEFWATWCGPCRVSIPHLTEMQKKLEERGVIFVGVSDEDSATVKPAVSRGSSRTVDARQPTRSSRCRCVVPSAERIASWRRSVSAKRLAGEPSLNFPAVTFPAQPLA